VGQIFTLRSVKPIVREKTWRGQFSHCYWCFRRFSQNCEKRLLATSCLSVCPSACNNSDPTRRIFMKFDIWKFFEILSKKLKFHSNLTRITGTSHEDQYTFFIISRSFLLIMRNVSDKSCRENQNTHFWVQFFFFKNPAVYEKMLKKKLYSRASHRWQYGAPALHAGYLRLQIHTLKFCNTHCFSTATAVARKHLNQNTL